MSTHLDGAPPSVAPDPDDGDPDDGIPTRGLPASVRVRRRLALGARGDRSAGWRRTARPAAATRAVATRPPGAGRAAARDVVVPDTRHEPAPPLPPPPAVPLPPPGFAAAGDLPENYVPRHSVQTPGPAAEPAAPVSGPIPIVRWPTRQPAPEAPNTSGAAPWAARRSRPRAYRCRSARSAPVPAVRCRSAARRDGSVVTAGHLDRPERARAATRRAAREARCGSNRCRPGGFRPPHRGVSRPRATRIRPSAARRPSRPPFRTPTDVGTDDDGLVAGRHRAHRAGRRRRPTSTSRSSTGTPRRRWRPEGAASTPATGRRHPHRRERPRGGDHDHAAGGRRRRRHRPPASSGYRCSGRRATATSRPGR